MAQAERIASWMRRALASAGARGFVVGLSGGLDSAVVARIAQLAAPGAVLGVVLPCHSDPRDESDAEMLAKHFSIPTTPIDLARSYDALVASLNHGIQSIPSDLRDHPSTAPAGERSALANIKARLRMTTLYALANTLDYLVAGTGNRSEIAVGYFTKYGDGGADLFPIGHLVKREVVALARDLNVPSSVIDRVPSAGFWPGQTDEDDLGFSYAALERYLDEGPQGVAPALAMRIDRMMRSTEHKRKMPGMLEV
jgi:NAD+ synthase